MKALLEAINRGILKGLTENNIELLSDLDDDNLDQLGSIQTKDVNNQYNVVSCLLQSAIRRNNISDKLKQLINNLANFDKFKGLIKANDKGHLKQLIGIGQHLFGDDGNFNWIDTSKITDMSSLFDNAINFNGDISRWDVSNVTNMDSMFWGSKFNRDISKWDVSNVTNMEFMFASSKFNGDISNWDVRNVEHMRGMFASSEFNGDISKWDVSNVEDMSFMFANSKFNGNISMWKINKKCKTICMFE